MVFVNLVWVRTSVMYFLLLNLHWFLFIGERRASNNSLKMPINIKQSVQQQNIRFLHTRSQYTEEYFKFMRNIAKVNAPSLIANDLNQVQTVRHLNKNSNYNNIFIVIILYN